MTEVKLTDAAISQATPLEDEVLGQAYGELDRRLWGDHNELDFHVFRHANGDYIMYPTLDGNLEVDACDWEDLGPYDVGPGHSLHGKNMILPVGKSGRGPR